MADETTTQSSDITGKIAGFLDNISEIESIVPEWAKLMLESIRVMINDFKNNHLELRSVCCSNNAELTKLGESFNARGAVIDALVMDRDRLSSEVKTLKRKVNELENYSRRSCLLFHGIPETAKKVTDELALEVIINELGLEGIDIKDIARTHRIGLVDNSRMTRKKKPKVRPIIVKFVSDRDRLSVYRQKKLLKGKSTYITESLSKDTLALYKKAGDKLGIENMWTSDNYIFAMVNKTRVLITSEEDLAGYE